MSVGERSSCRRMLRGCLAVVFATMAVGPAEAVELLTSPPLWKGVASFPRVAGRDAVAQRINETLQRADDRVRGAARDCAKSTDHPDDPAGAWSRKVRVTTSGPHFLSIVTDDIGFCGGVHPNSDNLALVFDLQTGRLVDWPALLPAALTGPGVASEELDGTKARLASSNELSRVYLQLYPTKPQPGVSKQEWPSCRDAVKEARDFLVWPTAKPNGLAIKPNDLVHVVDACGVPVIIPTAMLHSLDVTQPVIEAIEAAR